MKMPLRRLAFALVSMLPALALAVDPAAASPDQARMDAVLRYQLAAAEAEGDALSDAMVARWLGMTLDDEGWRTSMDPALVARADVVRQALARRVELAREDDASVLAATLRCPPRELAAPDCERDLARLAELAGDNAYHHFVLMGLAWARDDAEGFLRQARLAAAAAAYRHDFVAAFASTRARLRQAPEGLLPAEAGANRLPPADVHAMALASAIALPAYQHFATPCREAEGDLREQCLAIALHMLDARQTVIDAAIARAVVDALGDAGQRAEARERVRRAYWQSTALARAEREFDRAQHEAYFRLVVDEGELAAIAYAAAELGLPAEPPADWRAPGEPAAAAAP